jgi:hypothetical protein
MIDINYLSELFPFINLKALCDESNLKYTTIKNKIYRFRKNKDFGHLTHKETEKLSVGLGKKGLKLSDN